MNNKQITDISAYINAFAKISEESDIACTDRREVYRKAYFLERIAAELPIVISEDELIVGSMKIWQAKNRRKFWNHGHIAVDYPYILSRGIEGMYADAKSHRGEDTPAFLRVLDAFSLFIYRHGEAALALGMTTTAENCFHLSKHKPNTFHQALQLVWFVHLFLHIEGMEAAFSFGRFDRYLYPFYRADIDGGRCDRDAAKKLLAAFWNKTNEGDESQNLVVGGNFENELSLLCIELTGELCLPQPSLSVRYGSATTEAFKRAVNKLIRKGIGMPSIFNDETVIDALMSLGIPRSDAEDYAIVGCYEANPGNALGLTVAGPVRLHESLLAFLRENTELECDFDEFYRTFRGHLSSYYREVVLPKLQNRWHKIEEECASPFESVCLQSCVESGTVAEHGGAKYNMFGVNLLGIGTLIDSLYVMKKLIFEEHCCTYKDFVAEVLAGFPNHELALRCRSVKGKYGTDSEETNTLAAELSAQIAELVTTTPVAPNVITYPGLFIFYADIYASNYPATPDGRMAGERISYGIAPSELCVGTSATSILNSASHIANNKCACGNPLLLFLPSAEDELLDPLIGSYFNNGGFHLHINMADAKTMRAAINEPQKWENLTVRTSGFSARFITLAPEIQNALVERAEK